MVKAEFEMKKFEGGTCKVILRKLKWKDIREIYRECIKKSKIVAGEEYVDYDREKMQDLIIKRSIVSVECDGEKVENVEEWVDNLYPEEIIQITAVLEELSNFLQE